MGQRLNIEIDYDSTTLANAYYHWAGYTTSALELAKTICDNIKTLPIKTKIVKTIKDNNQKLLAIELLESSGATLSNYEHNKALQIGYDAVYYPEKVNRNNGLIAISEEGKEETRHWEEGRVVIDIKTNEVYFDCHWIVDASELLEDRSAVKTNIESTTMSFEEIDKLLSVVIKAEKKNGQYQIGEDIYSSIY